jgi:hypothetical protein
MATALQIQTSESSDSGRWFSAALCARREARSWFTTNGMKGHTVDSIRELLRFRRRVGEEFERLLAS